MLYKWVNRQGVGSYSVGSDSGIKIYISDYMEHMKICKQLLSWEKNILQFIWLDQKLICPPSQTGLNIVGLWVMNCLEIIILF